MTCCVNSQQGAAKVHWYTVRKKDRSGKDHVGDMYITRKVSMHKIAHMYAHCNPFRLN
jgi:hypothetical protein